MLVHAFVKVEELWDEEVERDMDSGGDEPEAGGNNNSDGPDSEGNPNSDDQLFSSDSDDEGENSDESTVVPRESILRVTHAINNSRSMTQEPMAPITDSLQTTMSLEQLHKATVLSWR